MNCTQAKTIQVEDFLLQLGYKPTREQGQNLWYRSPFREEQTASFNVNRTLNVWHDFGTGQGGDIIDLVKNLKNTERISQCLDFIEQTMTGTRAKPFSFHQQISLPKAHTYKLKELTSPSLLAYLESRQVSKVVAQAFCKEVHYLHQGKKYFAIAFPNDNRGYELRNPYFKGCLPPKEIRSIDKGSKEVNLFEGFIDFLSFISLFPNQRNVSALILNSVTNLRKAIPFLKKHEEISSFLDNDEAGKRAFSEVQSLGIPTNNRSALFAEYKDLNDYLVAKCKTKKIVITPKKRGLRR